MSESPGDMTVPGSSIRIIEPPVRGRVRHAMFDFDGTLSTIRDGWQDVMVPMMVETLASCPGAESRKAIEEEVIRFVDYLTGKQTIYQMIRLAEEVRKRGGSPRDPLDYKREYNARILPIAESRLAELASGTTTPDDLLVPGARQLLADLAQRDIRLYLASGTDVEFVRREAAALQIDHFFDGGIHGALANYRDFSKEKVIQQILSGEALRGPELLVLGDGYVEIQKARGVDAVAVGLVSPEGNHHHMNANKRDRLVRAGAQLLLEPDLRDGPALVEYLLRDG